MKTIGKLKLTQLSKTDLEARQMNALRGGGSGCICPGCLCPGDIYACDNSESSQPDLDSGSGDNTGYDLPDIPPPVVCDVLS